VVKARFEDGSVAAAEKDLHGCRSIYAALYRLPSDFLRTLLRESGVFLYSENPRVYTYANTAFVGVYNATEEDCVIRVKKDGIYTDYISGDTFRTEEGILRLFVMDETIFPPAPPLAEEDFSSPLLGRAFFLLWKMRQDNRKVTIPLLAEHLSPEEMNHISSICQQPESLQNRTQALADYIRIVKTESNKRAGTAIDPLLAATEKYKNKTGTGGKQS
jgi:hypothetical protein